MTELFAPVMCSLRSLGWGMITRTHVPSICSQNNFTLIKVRSERVKVVILKLIRRIEMVQDPHSLDEKKDANNGTTHVDVIVSQKMPL